MERVRQMSLDTAITDTPSLSTRSRISRSGKIQPPALCLCLGAGMGSLAYVLGNPQRRMIDKKHWEGEQVLPHVVFGPEEEDDFRWYHYRECARFTDGHADNSGSGAAAAG